MPVSNPRTAVPIWTMWTVSCTLEGVSYSDSIILVLFSLKRLCAVSVGRLNASGNIAPHGAAAAVYGGSGEGDGGAGQSELFCPVFSRAEKPAIARSIAAAEAKGDIELCRRILNLDKTQLKLLYKRFQVVVILRGDVLHRPQERHTVSLAGGIDWMCLEAD